MKLINLILSRGEETALVRSSERGFGHIATSLVLGAHISCVLLYNGPAPELIASLIIVHDHFDISYFGVFIEVALQERHGFGSIAFFDFYKRF